MNLTKRAEDHAPIRCSARRTLSSAYTTRKPFQRVAIERKHWYRPTSATLKGLVLRARA